MTKNLITDMTLFANDWYEFSSESQKHSSKSSRLPQDS